MTLSVGWSSTMGRRAMSPPPSPGRWGGERLVSMPLLNGVTKMLLTPRPWLVQFFAGGRSVSPVPGDSQLRAVSCGDRGLRARRSRAS